MLLTLAQLHRRYLDTVYCHVLSRCHDHNMAADMTQEVFIRACHDKGDSEAATPEQALKRLITSADREVALFPNRQGRYKEGGFFPEC